MVKDKRIIVKAMSVERPYTIIGLHLFVPPTVKTSLPRQEATDRRRIIEAQTSVKCFPLLKVRNTKRRMPAYLKPNRLVIRVLYVPHNMELVASQPITHSKIESERIFLQRLSVVMQSKDHLILTFGYEMKIHVACKTMTGQSIFFISHMIDSVPKTAHNRKEYR